MVKGDGVQCRRLRANTVRPYDRKGVVRGIAATLGMWAVLWPYRACGRYCDHNGHVRSIVTTSGMWAAA